ncbi:hypothetical protein F5X96DRAFT_642303 [Biscogniauxia mediterranea]|nr:hypothetical protein F5X96DRAFT_642303 [Biscogniauxia mediterranea]
MEHFHAHFRRSWAVLYDAAKCGGKQPAGGMSLKAYVGAGLSFLSQLETHHGIEETYIFPVLARRMPEFRALSSSSSPSSTSSSTSSSSEEKNHHHHGSEEQAEAEEGDSKSTKPNAAASYELLQQHREIHEGMEGMRSYLRACRAGEVELDLGVLAAQMETWGPVLRRHLDQEVEALGAENMRRYWTVEEIRRIPM